MNGITVLVDADACPVVKSVENDCKKSQCSRCTFV